MMQPLSSIPTTLITTLGSEAQGVPLRAVVSKYMRSRVHRNADI